MLFNSYDFLFLFLPTSLLCYYLSPIKHRNLIMACSGYIFYGYWSIRFCSILVGVTVLGYAMGNKIYAIQKSEKKSWLLLALFLHLGVLAYFKYANFFLDSLFTLFPGFEAPIIKVILPIGISFYIFQSISYLIDIYRGEQQPVDNFIDFACYISMFPQLIAGPIVRYKHIAIQLHQRIFSTDLFAAGIRLFIIGLAKKLLLADTIASIADPKFALTAPDFFDVWLGIIAFSLQIYFDFSGYSDMAIGLGRMFGFHLPENFNFPYQSRGISDFWRRWHMSLSYWLRDYVYIPLGGSRCSSGMIKRNIVVTMLLCGLWHGAAWTFVLWGGYFALLLIIERPFRTTVNAIPSFLSIPMTYFLVVIGWVFFRAESTGQAFQWLSTMFAMNGDILSTIQFGSYSLLEVVFLICIQVLCWCWPQVAPHWIKPRLLQDLGFAVLFFASIVTLFGKNVSPFLYYQF